MKALKKGSTGLQVKILQGMLNIHGASLKVDGGYGNLTVQAVKDFQDRHNLVVDGSAGPATQKAMGIMPTANAKICVIKIPFTAITKQGVCEKEKTRVGARCVEYLAEEKGYNFAINAGMFDTRTIVNCQDMVIGGKLPTYHGGNYSNLGLAFVNDRNIGCIYQSTKTNCLGKGVDFMGSSPSLILNGKKYFDMKGLPNGLITQTTKRIAIGVDAKHVFIVFSLNNCNLNHMVAEGLNQGIIHLMNMDGGGSQSYYIGGYLVQPTDGRTDPTAIGLFVKPFSL